MTTSRVTGRPAALAMILTLGIAAPGRAQQPGANNLELGDPARRATTFALAVDQIRDTRQGSDLSPDEVATALADAAIVLIGESHTSVESHRVQAQVIGALQRAGRRVVLGLEMFPASAPTAPFDRWIRGGVDEATLLRESGWYDYWGYPFGYYRDIFALARQHRLPMRGVNAPRTIVSQIGRRGLAGIGAMERAQLPPVIDSGHEEHRQLFVALAGGGSPTHGTGMSPETLQRMVDAQSTWDATMGYHAAQLYREVNDPKAIVAVLVGSGHVAYGLGIARQAKAYIDRPVATVMPVATTPGTPEQVRASLGDIVWGVPRETYPVYPTFGISFRSGGDPAMSVLMVAPGSAAEAMGIKAGDVIVSLDGTLMRRDGDVRAHMDRKQWADAVTAVVTRGSETLTLRGRLQRR